MVQLESQKEPVGTRSSPYEFIQQHPHQPEIEFLSQHSYAWPPSW